MSNPKEQPIGEALKAARAQRRQNAINNNSVIQALKGLWIFAEGVSLVVTSLYAIYQGRYGNIPTWGADVLMVAGVLVLVPAATLLSSFFRRVGKEG